MSRRAAAFLLLLGLLGLLLLPAAGAAGAAPAAEDDPPGVPVSGSPWFGPGLDWTDDSATQYEARLGRSPSLYGQRVNYPLAEDDTTYLRQFVEQAATQGAVAVVSLEPTLPLPELDESHAQELAATLVELHDELDTSFLVRFAPEMNGTWYGWGQQPEAYVAAFRQVAEVLRAATPHAAMVWSPVYGAGYPYGAAYGDVDPERLADLDELDTDGSGLLDEGDDPYGPYWPGADAVDWVGLTLYHFGPDLGRVDNELDPTEGGRTGDLETSEGFDLDRAPDPDAFVERLEERFNYGRGGGRRSFYERFAERHELPFLVETGALWIPDGRGDPEQRIKRAWWRQVLEATDSYPLVRGISWLEQRRPEAEAGGRTVDWRATRTDRLSEALLEDLDAAGVRLGPVTDELDQDNANEATAQGRLPSVADIPDSMRWITWSAAALAVVLLLSGLVGRLRPSWRYDELRTPETASRDLRVDLFRGFLICTVVVTHTEVGGPISWFSLNVFGAISGAEAFVALSGVVVGMVHRNQVARLGEWAASVLRWRRARTLYVTALAVVLLVYLLDRLPFLDASVVTTFTDRGTGAAGPEAAGRVYDLYVNGARLLDYPPPWYAVRELLFLRMGPWVLNVLGLFVVLVALSPALLWLLRRRLWWAVLAGSWAAWAYGRSSGTELLPSQFEDVFPLLVWQLVFVHGMVLGYHRAAVVRALTSRVGKTCCALVVVGYAAALGWLALADAGHLPLGPWDPATYATLYDDLYVRVLLQPGRLVDLAVVLVVSFAFLTAFWKPVHRATGWLLVPLGQASLYVFVIHVFLVVAVANVPGLDVHDPWQGALVHVAQIAIAWALVRKRVLFSVIPR